MRQRWVIVWHTQISTRRQGALHWTRLYRRQCFFSFRYLVSEVLALPERWECDDLSSTRAWTLASIIWEGQLAREQRWSINSFLKQCSSFQLSSALVWTPCNISHRRSQRSRSARSGATACRKNNGLRGVALLIHYADHKRRLESSSALGINYFLDQLVLTIDFSTLVPSGLSSTAWAVEPFAQESGESGLFGCAGANKSWSYTGPVTTPVSRRKEGGMGTVEPRVAENRIGSCISCFVYWSAESNGAWGLNGA